MRAPSWGDWTAYARWRGLLEAAEVAQSFPWTPFLIDATAAYRHFLEGHGRTRRIDYERFITGDPNGRRVLAVLKWDLRSEIEYWVDSGLEDFAFRSREVISVRDGGRYPYPATENWQKTLGGHFIWVDGRAHREGMGGYACDVRVHVEDRYDFNPGDEDIATGISDAENGRLSLSGLGNPYLTRGLIHRHLRWKKGDLPLIMSGAPTRRAREPRGNRLPWNSL